MQLNTLHFKFQMNGLCSTCDNFLDFYINFRFDTLPTHSSWKIIKEQWTKRTWIMQQSNLIYLFTVQIAGVSSLVLIVWNQSEIKWKLKIISSHLPTSPSKICDWTCDVHLDSNEIQISMERILLKGYSTGQKKEPTPF